MIKNRTYKGYKVDGDLMIGHDANVCGSLAVSKDAVFKGSVRINGILNADNIDSCNKGFFPNATELEKAYPTPKPGWWAIVGESLPGDIYSCSSVKKWKNTGIKGSLLDDHSDYSKLMEEIESIKDHVFQLTADIRHNPSGIIQFDGNEKNGSLYWACKKGDLFINPDHIIITQTTATSKKTLYERTRNPDDINDIIPYTGIINTTVGNLGTTTFTCTFIHNGIKKSNSIQVTQVMPVFIGTASEAFNFSNNSISGFDKVTVESSDSFSIPVNVRSNAGSGNRYIYICIPDTMSLEDVKLSGIDVSFNKPTKGNYYINGTGYPYKIYRTSGTPISGVFNLEITITNIN